jgi:hypothetical protein
VSAVARARIPLLLSAAVVLYCIAAWSVAPGFYDGLAPNQPYQWVSPPAQEAAGNKQPQGLHQVALGGKAASAATQDGQAQLYIDPGTFPSGQSVTIDIKPTATYPPVSGFIAKTNVYLITASAPLNGPVSLFLRYSTQVVPVPTAIYGSPQAGGAWSSAGTPQTTQPYFVSVRTSQLGYFVAGAPASAPGSSGGNAPGGGSPLPVIAAVAIGLTVLAGVPLLLDRRNRGRRRVRAVRPQTPAGAKPSDAPAKRGGGARRRKRR